MMATHELVVPRSIPITGPETFEELKRAPMKDWDERALRGRAVAKREDLAERDESFAAEIILK
jgi:hypothetical protein